jgi:hypothetical protein
MAMTLRLSTRLEEGLKAEARRQGLPQSELVARAVEEFLRTTMGVRRVSYAPYRPVAKDLRVTVPGPSTDSLLDELREDRF